MQVHDFVLGGASRTPSAPYLWAAGDWTNYRTVASSALRLAHHLVGDLGIVRGSRIALLWENASDAVVSLFGILAAGGTLVPVNTDLKGPDLAYILNHSGAEALIASPRLARRVLDVAADLTSVRVIVTDAPVPEDRLAGLSRVSWTEIAGSGVELSDPVATTEDDLAAIVYTSGSTGTPKGVMLSHRNLVSNMHSIVEYLELGPEDRVMMVLPHFYIYGLSLLLTHTLVGGSVVMDNRFMYPNTVLQNIVDNEVTGFSGVPSTFTILLARSTVREMSFPALRYVTQAGGAMAPAVQQQVADLFAPARLFIMYGATEAAPRLSYLKPEDLPRKWGSIGKAIPGVELYVADSEGECLPAGHEGEIVASGPNITSGYWKDPVASAAVLRNGRYFTGDLGMEDEEGFLFVTGRSKDIIKVKGFRVSPREIEERLLEVEGVSEAAVIGVPDDLLGEAPVAYVVSADGGGPTEDLLRRALQQRLASYKVPTGFVFLETLPQNASGKIDKQVLREDYSRRSE